MEKFFGVLRRTVSDVGSVFREAAHDAVYDFRDNAVRGFGLPSLVTAGASFTVAVRASLGFLLFCYFGFFLLILGFGRRQCVCMCVWCLYLVTFLPLFRS
mgnify:FL=1